MTDREPASMSEASKPCVIWECIYDHGNGKFMGEASRAQRERAFAELRRLHAENEALRAQVANLTRPFGESHLSSLIEAAIQGHASTREAMRWFAAQISPKAARKEST